MPSAPAALPLSTRPRRWPPVPREVHAWHGRERAPYSLPSSPVFHPRTRTHARSLTHSPYHPRRDSTITTLRVPSHGPIFYPSPLSSMRRRSRAC